MIKIIGLVNFFMGLIDETKHTDIDKYYNAIWEMSKNINLKIWHTFIIF